MSMPGLGDELGVHHEPPAQQHRGHRENGEHRVDGHHHGDQHPEVELGEVPLQGLAIEFLLDQPGRRIGELDPAQDQEAMTPSAYHLTQGDRHGPGKSVHARADGAAGKGRGEQAEDVRSPAVGQAEGGGGEGPAVDDAAVYAPLGQHEQRDRCHHRVNRRKQDRDRHHPDGEEVPGHAALQVGHPRCRRHGNQPAAQQQSELPRIRYGATSSGRLRSRRTRTRPAPRSRRKRGAGGEGATKPSSERPRAPVWRG